MDKSRTVWDKIQTFPENIELGVRYTLSSGKPRSEPSVPDSCDITVVVRWSPKLHPAAPTPDDVVAISRYQLKQLDESLGAYLGGHPNADLITRAHLDNCSDVINEALKAVYVKNSY